MDVQGRSPIAAADEAPLPEVYAALVADTLALLDAMRREAVDVLPHGVLPGLGEPLPPLPAAAAGGRFGPLKGAAPAAVQPGSGQPATVPAAAATPAASQRIPPQSTTNPFAMGARSSAPAAGQPATPPPATAPARATPAAPPRATPVTPATPARPTPLAAPTPRPPPAPIAPPPFVARDDGAGKAAEPAGRGLFGARWAALREDPADLIRAFYREIGDCRRCDHCDTRGRILHGEGKPDADVLILTGMPTAADDASGRMFTGPAGDMLDRMLLNVLARERGDVHVAGALMCAGPTPTLDALTACRPFLDRRLDVVRPRVILAMGPVATSALGLPARHGWHRYGEREVFATFHPDELIADPSLKREAFEHLKQVRARIG